MTALQCPGCGHIHSEGEHGSGRTFRCRGCHRLLSVPVAVAAAESGYGDDSDSSLPLFTGRTAAPERPRPTARPSPHPGANGRPPISWTDDTGDLTDPSAGFERPPEPGAGQTAAARSTRRSRRIPLWQKLLVWAVALAIGLVFTAVLLRAVGVLDVDAVIDAYAERGLRRYATLLVLVPLWAAAAATLAHLTLEWVARRRAG